ncbi:GNAT family N-acetyltransferase [Catenuloplanes atrovinosus]|uniref:RimJ/RimL family protein N-acetyltransferase n=1 Tax=Catenuloplanes atrovinosus TaxID=137266 RepID=A0AAE4C8T9_9ACTN|nr:GNAT family N-acetyltransferase [Catenuloplanes atrovinosus]MDR7275876.1 RimJ/RimL family protein N-acetyltransferase [Catenuloplanes atrovinosus]
MTARLLLSTPAPDDLDELFGLYSDPRVWAADPLARHDSPEQTARMLDVWRRAWERDGHGMWVARRADGTFVGIGGCFIRYGVAWNLGFRLLPRFWGHGYAQELAAAARETATARRPDLAMTAYLLEGNDRSRRTVERAGLHRVWRGPDAGNPDPDAIRLLYADRALDDDVIRALTDY